MNHFGLDQSCVFQPRKMPKGFLSQIEVCDRVGNIYLVERDELKLERGNHELMISLPRMTLYCVHPDKPANEYEFLLTLHPHPNAKIMHTISLEDRQYIDGEPLELQLEQGKSLLVSIKIHTDRDFKSLLFVTSSGKMIKIFTLAKLLW